VAVKRDLNTDRTLSAAKLHAAVPSPDTWNLGNLLRKLPGALRPKAAGKPDAARFREQPERSTLRDKFLETQQ
jgi:hypothetical protein